MINSYNAGRGGQSFDDGGTWSPEMPSRKLEGHPGVAKNEAVQLSPQAYSWFVQKTGEEAARRLAGRITPAMIRNPDRSAVEMIKDEYEKARGTVRDALKRKPVSSLRED